MSDGQIVCIPLVWLEHVICGKLICLLSWRTDGFGPCIGRSSFPGDPSADVD